MQEVKKNVRKDARKNHFPSTCKTEETETKYKDPKTRKWKPYVLKNPPNCSFPFNYKGRWRSECIGFDDPDCRLWCSVKNDFGYHRKHGSQWAWCKPDCPYFQQASCRPLMDKSGFVIPHFLDDEKDKWGWYENTDPNFDFYDSFG